MKRLKNSGGLKKAMKEIWRSLPLRRFFILTVVMTVVAVSLMSALIISGCAAFRHWLLPDSNKVYLTIESTNAGQECTTCTYLLQYGQELYSPPELIKFEDGELVETGEEKQTRYGIQKVENSFDMLSPKRKFAYRACGIAMAVAPAVLAFAGIFLCSMYFYRKKMRQPLEILSDAADKIAQQNLDFVLSYGCKDEMGALCESFENMRKALYDNYKQMWEMIEERRLLQASVAHDLRNPIAIIRGYTEYLEKGLTNQTISQEKAVHIVENVNMASRRLEQYTESVRLLNQSEMAEINTELVFASKLAEELAEDMKLLAEQRGLVLSVTQNLPNEQIQVDTTFLYRILENVIGNALRFADKQIHLAFALSNHRLSVTVTDDGAGFSSQLQEKKQKYFVLPDRDGHMGIGLAVSRLLCKKHGGSLELSNTTQGACVKIVLSV